MSRQSRTGFTIVELLIVIVVIAILAAITVVAFSGIQERSRASAVSSALSQAAKKLSLYQVDNPDQYPAAAGTNGLDNLAPLGITNSGNVTYQYTASGNTYCLTATTGTTSYKLSNTTTAPTKGGCAGHGQNGVAAVKNLVANPSFETNTSIWTGGGDQGSPTITRNTGGQTGTYRVTLSKAAPVGSAQFNYVADSLTAGTTYTLGFWAWADAPGTASVQLARNNISFSPFITMTVPVTTTPTYFTASGTAPADSTQMRLRVTPKTDGTATHYDGFIITEGTGMTTYADGSTQDWVWDGTAHLSTSTGPVK